MRLPPSPSSPRQRRRLAGRARRRRGFDHRRFHWNGAKLAVVRSWHTKTFRPWTSPWRPLSEQ